MYVHADEISESREENTPKDTVHLDAVENMVQSNEQGSLKSIELKGFSGAGT